MQLALACQVCYAFISTIMWLISASDEHGFASPVVVHCSAGIGRTGTLIAIDQCMAALHSIGR